MTQMNIFMKQTQNRPVVAKRYRQGMDWEFGFPDADYLYIEWIKNEILPYTTGNYIQYPMIDHNEKYEKEYILKLNHFAA